MSIGVMIAVMAIALLGVCLPARSQEATEFRSHPPIRPLPQASARPIGDGPSWFVDPSNGDDRSDGTQEMPWKSLGHALKRLRPGDTLYLRAGTYFERPSLSRSGTADAPITIRSFPGESVVIDGGWREFYEEPAPCWEPFDGGAVGEFVSTRTYPEVNTRRVPSQFLPAAWEPMWGVEEERPIALGHFADSMLPLHGYRTAADLRAENEFWLEDKNDRMKGVYCGPGLWFNRETERVHIRLAHHKLPGLGQRAYRGETDPRKLPLVIALGFGEEVLRISGIKHVRISDLVLRGATGSPLIHVYGSQNVELDHLSVFGGFPGLLLNASQNIRLTHSAFRGLAAPWHGRSHMKYRGTASYQIVLQNNQPLNENIEFAWCEFTDDHDFAFLRFAKNLQFHHNYIDNFNDDGLECGPKLRDHTIFIYQNHIGACLGTFQQHEISKDESPADHDPQTGVFIFRNVIDSRGGVPYSLPKQPDPSGAFLHYEGALASDHGSPVWPVMHFYQNTVLRQGPVFRDNYLFGLAAAGMRNTERDVFNNIFVQVDRVPGVNFVAVQRAENLREGGNLLWSLHDGPDLKEDPFVKFRASALFQDSRKIYEAGWTTHDRIANPQFVELTVDVAEPVDLRLRADSPAVRQGIALPAEWHDPLRREGTDHPDIGALPLGAKPWSVGVDGRLSMFGPASVSD